MRVLFTLFSEAVCQNSIFLGTVLELIQKHIELGDDVYVLVDNNFTRKSTFNIKGSFYLGFKTYLRVKYALSIINFPKNNILKLKKAKIERQSLIFNDVEELKKYSLWDVDFGAGVASTIISIFREPDINTFFYKDLINKLLYSSISIYETTKKYIKEKEIDLVYFFNGRFSDNRPIYRACQNLKVDFFSYEMGSNLYSYVLFKNSWVHDIENFHNNVNEICHNNLSNTLVAKNWFKERRNGRQGRVSFVTRQIKGYLPKNFDNKKRNIVIYNSSIDEYASIIGFKNNLYKDEIDAYKSILEFFKDEKDFKFYLRVHPNLSELNNSQIKKLKEIKYNNLEIIWPESLVDSYELLFNCEKVLTFGSTIGVESCFWEKPVILLGRAFYEKLGCVYIPQNNEDLMDLIKNKLEPKKKIGALKYAYYLIYRNISYKNFNPNKSLFNGKSLIKYSLPVRLILKILSFL